MPIEHFQARAPSVGEHKHGIHEWTELELTLHQGRQSVDLLSEINGIAMQIDRSDGVTRMHQRCPPAGPPSSCARAAIQPMLGRPDISRRTPEGRTRLQFISDALPSFDESGHGLSSTN